MKVLILSNSDGRGGAYAAAFRLLQGLEKINVSVKMLVRKSTRGHRFVIGPQKKLHKLFNKLRPHLDSIPLKLYHNRKHVIFSTAILPDNLTKKILALQPDLIHLHWVTGGFLRLETLRRFKKPLVWTFHDMWPFTGGCHLSEKCDRYKESCGKCPMLGSSKNWDLSRWIWYRKKKAWRNLNLTIVTPSHWLANCAKASSLFHDVSIKVIPNCLDFSRFKPVDKRFARELLSLPQDKKIILFGAMSSTTDKNKGFQLLLPTLKALAANGWRNKAELLVFGASEAADSPEFGLKAHYIGYLNDDISLALLYAAVDVMLVPSIQESFGQTASEAMACGTPVVAFGSTGLLDIVEHKRTGYLAQPYETGDLAKGIEWVLSDEARRQLLSNQARKKAENEFALEIVAQRYANLYKEIIE